MNSYEEMKVEMKANQPQMVETKHNEPANALKAVKRLCIEFSYTSGC